MSESVRPFWKGYLRLALVAIPVRLVTAERAEAGVKFHQIDRKTRQRIRYLKVVPGKGEVKKEDIVMGYETEPGNYVLMEDAELDAVRLESRHTIELTQFVDAHEIDPLYFERPYYVIPDGDVAEEGYRVIRDALRARKKAAIGQLTLRGRENLVALYAGGNGLVLDTLRYEEEIKDADDVFAGIGAGQSRADMLAMAEQLIDSRSQSFDPTQFKNHYAEALRELVKRKLSTGQSVPIDDDSQQEGKVVDFMDALKRSLAGKPAETAARAPQAKHAPAKAKATKTKPTKSAPSKKRA